MTDRRLARAVAALLLSVACIASATAAQDRPTESAVKAAYLFKLASFVEWPEDAFASPGDPLQLCVIGSDTIGSLAADAAAGQTVGARTVIVRRLPRDAVSDTICHVMFIGVDAEATAALERARGRPVLTVTEIADTRAHGVINFVVDGNRVRFEIDLEAAAQNRLTISSKLLSLAIKVKQAS